MASDPSQPQADPSRRAFRLPPSLDMGHLKLEDLSFDIDGEVARLRGSSEEERVRR